MLNPISRMILDKTLKLIGAILIIETLQFALMYALAGDSYQLLFYGRYHWSPALREGIISHNNFDMPIYVQYLTFLINELTCNFGNSAGFNVNWRITDFIWNYTARTLLLFVIAAVSSIILATIGIWLFRKKRLRSIRPIVRTLALCVFAIPSLIMSLMAILILNNLVPSWPFAGSESINHSQMDPISQFIDLLQHSFLPIAILTIGSTAAMFLLFRRMPTGRNISEKGTSADARGSRFKKIMVVGIRGLSEVRPMMLLLFSWIMGQMLIIEYIFTFKGLGYLTWQGLMSHDFPLVLSSTYLMAAIVLISWFIFDLSISIILATKIEKVETLPIEDISKKNDNKRSMPDDKSAGIKERIEVRSLSVWLRYIISGIKSDRVCLFALLMLFIFMIISIIGPFIAPENPLMVKPGGGGIPQPPSGEYLLGTDSQQKDILSQLLYGTKEPVFDAFLVLLIAVPLGTVIGMVAVRLGRYVDSILVTLATGTMAISVCSIMLISAAIILSPRENCLSIILIGVVGCWPVVAITVRNELRSRRELYFEPETNYRTFRDLFHVGIPRILPRIFGVTKFLLVIFPTSVTLLDFLGLGNPNNISWGWMLDRAHANGAMLNFWWWWIFPPVVGTVLLCGSSYALMERLERITDKYWKENRMRQ